MPAALLSRDEVLTRIRNVFRDFGFDGASLLEISKATGLGKSSLYHYFPGGKDEMAAAVLARVDTWLSEISFGPLRSAGTAQNRLRQMLHNLNDYYAGGRNPCVLGALVIGSSRKRFEQPLRNAFVEWVKAFASLATESGITKVEASNRAEDAVVRIEGALIVAAALDDLSLFRRTLKVIERDLLKTL